MTSQNDRDRFNWLHFGNWLGPGWGKDRADKAHWKALFEDLARLHDASGPWDVVFITGNIAQTAAHEEYELATTQLVALLDKLSELGSKPVLMTVPGALDSHPPSRPGSELLEDLLAPDNHQLEILSSLFWREDDIGNRLRNYVQDSFRFYLHWSDGLELWRPQELRRGALPGDSTATIPLGTKRLGIAGLNSAVFRLPADPRLIERIPLEPRQLKDACGGDVESWAGDHDICWLLTHHPPAWLNPEARRAFYSEIAPPFRFGFHLCSRLDPSDSPCVRDGPTLLVQATPFRAEGRESGYIAGVFSLMGGPEMVSLYPRRYEAGPKARFIPDPSYPPVPPIRFLHSVRRKKPRSQCEALQSLQVRNPEHLSD